MPVPLLLVISGPSGSGKTTLCERLGREFPDVRRFVTTTTRAPRPGEQEGVDYYFLSRAEFERRAAAGAFLEYAQVSGNLYGTERSRVEQQLAAGHDLLLNIDVQGAEAFRAEAARNPTVRAGLVTLFVLVEDLEELRARLVGRGAEDAAALERRLATAREEIPHARHFDHVIPSRDKASDYAALRSIYLREKAARAGVQTAR